MSQLGKSAYMGSNYLGNPVVSPARHDSHLRLGEQSMRLPSNMKSISGRVSGHPPSSSRAHFAPNFLEEVNNNKSKCFEIAYIVGHVVEFSFDQFGSQFIHQKLERARNDEKKLVFREIKPQALYLMSNMFGNLVVQKRKSLANRIQGHVLQLSLRMYACRVVQKRLEHCDYPDIRFFVMEEITKFVCSLVLAQYGNYVVQHVLEHGKPE